MNPLRIVRNWKFEIFHSELYRLRESGQFIAPNIQIKILDALTSIPDSAQLPQPDLFLIGRALSQD